ncbi:MAG TPA: hypothetical protein VGI60_09795 [Chthoniobacterales bacterium]|jgi:hypothetical protein
MTLLLILVVWLLLAAGLGASDELERLRPPGPQLILLGLTAALLLLWWLNRGVRASVGRVRLRALVGLHLTRFVGLYFLYLCGEGGLPREFAVPAGWGDTAVATGVAVSLIFWSSFGSKRPWLRAWNTLGLIDIIFVVLSAARIGMVDPGAMAALLRFPLSLLPTFLVPLIIVTHIVIFSRLRGERTTRTQSV